LYKNQKKEPVVMRVPFYFIALLTWLTHIQKKEPRWTP
jgi:hypothetical protein